MRLRLLYNSSRMSHTYYSLLVHCVFSTKERQILIPAELKIKLWPYMAGIARMNRFKALAVGGMQDHAHILLSLPMTIQVAKAVQLIKGGSSKWINDHLPTRPFAWQDSYTAFSIGISQLPTTIRYIDKQEWHHARMNFNEELLRMLERHGIEPYRGPHD
jgi:REP element-mobilizing transposase RayT